LPTLTLIRSAELVPAPPHEAHVTVEMNTSLRAGSVALLYPTGDRRFLYGQADQVDGHDVRRFGPLPDGSYEARSTAKAKKSATIYFTVKNGQILDVERLSVASPSSSPTALPALVGSLKQVEWASKIRPILLGRLADYPELLDRARPIQDSQWWIANKDKTPAGLRMPTRRRPQTQFRPVDATRSIAQAGGATEEARAGFARPNATARPQETKASERQSDTETSALSQVSQRIGVIGGIQVGLPKAARELERSSPVGPHAPNVGGNVND
jgi:hypothetical protein